MRMVDTSCVIEIDVDRAPAGNSASRGSGWHATSKRWSLTAGRSRLSIRSSDRSGDDPRYRLDKFLEDHSLLCKIVAFPARIMPQQKLAVISVADTWSYVLEEGKNHLHMWDGMVARLEYAEQSGFRYYIWLGTLPFDTLGFQRRDEWPEGKCIAKEVVGIHIIKALAALATFEVEPDLEAVAYMDADTIPHNLNVNPMDYLAIDPTADFIGTSNHKLPILVNGGVWILRNTAWGKKLMQKWWSNRCGVFDQGALWHSLFELWREEVKFFTYNVELFNDYERARANVLPMITNSRALQMYSEKSNFSCGGKCREVYRQSGCLTQALLLPHVLILPVVPTMVPSGRLFLPLQHHIGQAQWLCHFDTPTTRGLCYSQDVAALQTVNETNIPPIRLNKCVEGNDGKYGYSCDCHQLLLGQKNKAFLAEADGPEHHKKKSGKKR